MKKFIKAQGKKHKALLVAMATIAANRAVQSYAETAVANMQQKFKVYRQSKKYVVTFSSKQIGSSVFNVIVLHLTNLAEGTDFRKFEASDGYRVADKLIPDTSDQGGFKITIEGVECRVTVKLQSKQNEYDDAADGSIQSVLKQYMSGSTITMTSYDRRIIDVAEKLMNKSKKDAEIYNRGPKVMLGSTWGGWDEAYDLPARPLASVFLPGSLGADILADIRKFQDDEERYVRLGIPYHRAYCFYGPPGTGKSSLIGALCHELKLNACYLSIHDESKDNALFKTIARVPEHSALIIEDIDTANIKRDDDSDKKISLGALLNALDGLVTPPGLITFMTSNQPEVLDEALVRKGRIDKMIEITYPIADQVEQIFLAYFGVEVRDVQLPHEIKMSDITEVFKTNEHFEDVLAGLYDLGVSLSV